MHRAVIGSGIMAQRLTGDGAVALCAQILGALAGLLLTRWLFVPLAHEHRVTG